MIRALFGLQPIGAGAVNLRSQPTTIKHASPHLRIAQGVGYLSEDRNGEGLALALPIADNITLTRFSTCADWGWVDVRKQRQQATTWVRSLAIKAADSFQRTGTLSGGNQQKVALARLLHQDADILLLDEPTRGIDIGSKAQIYEVMVGCAEANKAVLLVSSYLPELFGMCDRLAVMCRGRLSPARPIDRWTPELVLQTAIGAEAA